MHDQSKFYGMTSAPVLGQNEECMGFYYVLGQEATNTSHSHNIPRLGSLRLFKSNIIASGKDGFHHRALDIIFLLLLNQY